MSGAQLNPTVTLAALLWGRVSGRRALALGCAQLAGAAAGAALLRLLAPPARALCLTLPAPGLAVYKVNILLLPFNFKVYLSIDQIGLLQYLHWWTS